MRKLLLSIFLCFSLCNVPAVSLPKFFSLETMAYAFFWGKPGGPSFLPSHLANLKLWLKADAITGLNDGDPITTWSDSSGQGNDATQTVAANKPIYKTGIVNGKPVTRYDGVNDFFNLPNFLAGFTAGDIFITVKIVTDPPPANQGLIHFSTAAFASLYPFGDGIIYDGFGSTVRKTTVDPSPSLASWRVYNVYSQANDWTSFLDNTQLFNTVTNTVGWPSTPYIGRGVGTGTYYLEGDIAEVVFYSSVLSSGDRTSVYNYLKSKYGL